MGSPSTEDIYQCLSRIYLEQQRDDEAIIYLHKLLKLQNIYLSRDDEDFKKTLNTLCELYRKQNNPKKAEQLAEEWSASKNIHKSSKLGKRRRSETDSLRFFQ